MDINECCVDSLVADRIEVPPVYPGSEANILPADGTTYNCATCNQKLIFRFRPRIHQWFNINQDPTNIELLAGGPPITSSWDRIRGREIVLNGGIEENS